MESKTVEKLQEKIDQIIVKWASLSCRFDLYSGEGRPSTSPVQAHTRGTPKLPNDSTSL